MKLLLLLALFAPSFSWAVTIRPSVSEGFFVCNAGIAHKVATGTTCADKYTGLACNASDDTSCVCADSTAGEDTLTASWDDLTVAEASPLRSRGNTLKSNTVATYNNLFTDLNAWNNNVTSIEIGTSSETYGTSYFVDFCYQGPVEKIQKKNGKNQDVSEGIYTITANVAAANQGSGLIYQQDSNLGMTLQVNCDLRDVGKSKNARSSNEFAPSGNALEADVTFASSGYPRSSTLSMSQRLNSKTNYVPRFCSVRAIFTEMANSSSVKVRPNSASPTEFTIDLDITNGDLL